MKEQFTFRKIEHKEELKCFMKLRYQTYRSSDLNCILRQNNHQLDINVFDIHSEHFGLFCNDQPAGYVRLVLPRKEKYDLRAFEIGNEIHLFKKGIHCEKALKSLNHPEFPFLNYPDLPPDVRSYYNAIVEKQECLFEPSRMAISKQYRGTNTSKFLIECSIILYLSLCSGKSHAMICCNRSHVASYLRYGLKRIRGSARSIRLNDPNSPDFHYESMDLSITRMSTVEASISNSNIPKKLHPKFFEMYSEYKNHNQITRTL